MTTTESPFHVWFHHFDDKRKHADGLPWDDPYQLTAEERALVQRSIQQFQLGEYARGRGFRRRAAEHPVLGSDPTFLSALDVFISEEQTHSSLLGRFLDNQEIPRLERDRIDGIFRKLRKLAGLDVCVTVLVTAEVLAMPFYSALKDATKSPLLQSICKRILRDEAGHLKYQALTLGTIRRPVTSIGRAIRARCHATLFYATAIVLWLQHRSVFQAAGWNFRSFWRTSGHWFYTLQTRINQHSAGI